MKVIIDDYNTWFSFPITLLMSQLTFKLQYDGYWIYRNHLHKLLLIWAGNKENHHGSLNCYRLFEPYWIWQAFLGSLVSGPPSSTLNLVPRVLAAPPGQWPIVRLMVLTGKRGRSPYCDLIKNVLFFLFYLHVSSLICINLRDKL